MSRHDLARMNDSRQPSPMFELLEPRAMLAGDFAIAWNGPFINPTPGSDFGLHLTPGTVATPPAVDVGTKLVPPKKSSPLVRPLLNIGNVGTGRLHARMFFDYYIRPASAVDNSQDVLLYHNRASGGISDDSKFITGHKHQNQVDIKNLVLQVPFNTPAGDYVLVAIISKTYDTPNGTYKKNALPHGDGDDTPADNIAISAPFTVKVPSFNLTGSLTQANVNESVSQGHTSNGNLLVKVTNEQGLGATAPTDKVVNAAAVDITVFLRLVGAVDDSQDIAVGSLTKASVGGLKVGKSRTFSIAYKTEKALAAGQYKLVAVVDKLIPVDGKPLAFSGLSGKLTEIDDSNADNSTQLTTQTITVG